MELTLAKDEFRIVLTYLNEKQKSRSAATGTGHKKTYYKIIIA